MSDPTRRMAAAADKLGLTDQENISARSSDEKHEVSAWTQPTDELLESTDEYRRHESGYYFEDEEHFGTIFVSQKW